MSKATFTPGPWGWFGNTKHDFYLATKHSGRTYVMAFERKGMSGAQPVFRSQEGYMVKADSIPIFEVCRDATSADDERVYRKDIVGFRNADAHLIAAAPELYEALKAITDCFGVGYVSAEKFVEDVTELMHEGRAALSRARGEAS